MGFVYFRYYNVLDRPFYERTIFSYLSGMKVTIEDGLPYLLKANEGLFHMECVFRELHYISSIFTLETLVCTRPYYMNWLYLGKSYLSLKRKDEAKHWLQKVAESESTGATLDEYVSLSE